MKRTFVYKKKSSVSIYPMLAFAIIAVACFIFKYGIAFRNFTLLEYPKSAIIAALIAIGFGIYYFLEKNKEKSSNAKPNFIEATEAGIHFSTSKGEFTVAYSDVKELWHKEDNDEILAIIYTTSKERYEWGKDGFDSAAEFAEFEKILNENCTNITNR